MRDEDRLVINANLQRLLSDKQSLQEELEIHQQQKAALSEALVVANQQLAKDAQLREELETLRREYGSSAEARVELAAVQGELWPRRHPAPPLRPSAPPPLLLLLLLLCPPHPLSLRLFGWSSLSRVRRRHPPLLSHVQPPHAHAEPSARLCRRPRR